VEGTIVEEGALAVGRSYTCQIAVGSVSEGGHTPMLDYCGGVFHSELTVCICNNFGGFESIYEGCTFLGHTWFIWTCISVWIKLLLYQVHLYFVLAVFHHLFSSDIDIYPKLVFPRGVFIQGHVDQKYMCTK
jgi:hypothetical protein